MSQGITRKDQCIQAIWTVVAGCTLGGMALEAHGAAFWGREPDGAGQIQFFADVINEPNSIWSWGDLTDSTLTITYRLDNAFRAAYSDTRIHDQVRLAFNQWDTANVTPNGTQFSYFRDNGNQPFGDIRSIAVHELGHVMGFGHPNQADDAVPNRNYQLDGGGNWVQSAAVGTESMNSFINPGRYNHILSQDELAAYRFAYDRNGDGTPRNINFVEVGATDASADITITTYTNVPTNWAQGPPTATVRNAANPAQGSQINSGIIRWNTNSDDPLGFRTLGINWDYQNVSGASTDKFEIRTRGTDNPTPLFHYDNNGWPQPFNSYSNSPVGANFKDDLLHVWENPQGGPIPTAEVLHVGLEQDVWDWTVVSAQTVSPGGTRTDAPLLGFHDWNNSIVGPSSLTAEDGIFKADERVIARGIRIIGPHVLADVSDLWIGNVTGLDLQLDELNRDVFKRLQEEKQVFQIEGFGNILMGHDEKGDPNDPKGQALNDHFFEDFILVLEGDEQDLPKELLEQKNFLFLRDIPGVKPGEELFLVATSKTEEVLVTTFGLVGDTPIIFDPEVLKGDFNLDDEITGRDIDPFILALTDPEAYAEKFGRGSSLVGDLNGDLGLTGLDISNFVSLLTNEWPKGSDLVSSFPAPEPTSFLILCLSGAPLMMRRRQRLS